MNGEFPASGFEKLACLLESEGSVFQRHVLDLVRDVIEDSDLHRRTISLLRSQISAKELSDFLNLPPLERGDFAQSKRCFNCWP